MKSKRDETLLEQINLLLQDFGGPFPYEDCRMVLETASETFADRKKDYQNLIPDLDSYFYTVYSYAAGVAQVMTRSDVELVKANSILRNSFFQSHPKYNPLEGMINQISTPKLYKQIAISNQLRPMLRELFMNQLQSLQRASAARQAQIFSISY